MISLAQTALMGSPASCSGTWSPPARAAESKGLTARLGPRLSLVLAILGTTAIGLIFGAVAARWLGIYFLMITLTFSVIAFYFFGQVTVVSGFSRIQASTATRRASSATSWPTATASLHRARTALVVYVLIRYVFKTPFGLSLQGVRDERVRMGSLGYIVPLHRTLAFGFAAFSRPWPAILSSGGRARSRRVTVGLGATIDLLILAVIGGLGGSRAPGSARSPSS